MIDVSRETRERLGIFVDLLSAWTQKINLIAPSTRKEIWERHIEDSLQIYPLAPQGWRTWVDLGSGGGLPGIIVAILAADDDREITLVESDARKCAFLRTALRETGARAKILNARAEEVPPVNADVVSARALAPLPKLLGYAERHVAPNGIGLFQKGKNASAEIEEALERWRFACEKHPSKTDADGVILRIGDLKRA
ncbi:MAG: 16S rRNA (guanine(527)-N(7))-methyltransferase RsmG [Pseudomonadota bacterium]